MFCALLLTVALRVGAATGETDAPSRFPQKESERPSVNWYWRKIRAIAARDFSGMDLEFVLNTTWQAEGENKGPGVGWSIPLYSKEKRLNRREAAENFLRRGAELIGHLETSLKSRRVYVESLRFIQARARDDGIEMLDKYQEMQVKIIKEESLITQYHRELQALIDPYTPKVKIHSSD